MSIRFFDMFSGIGGFRSGLEAVGGFECIGHCEIDKHANQAYSAIYDILGIFSGGIDLGLDDINSLIEQQQTVGESTLTAIEEEMLSEGYSQLKVEEAQAIYLLALFDKTDEENFVERLVGCFASEQTDTQLITAVNDEFGTAINPSDFTVAVQEIRDKYAEQEESTTQ